MVQSKDIKFKFKMDIGTQVKGQLQFKTGDFIDTISKSMDDKISLEIKFGESQMLLGKLYLTTTEILNLALRRYMQWI
jgi:hypothetical protein